MSDPHFGDFERRHQDGVWHFLNRLMVTLIVFAGIVLIVCAFVPELKKQREQNARLDQLKADIERQKALLTQRTREVELLKNDPGYVETLARDRLDLMKEGETIYRLEPQSQEKPAETKPAK
ncbi:MAG: septum formation initiator family protein [Verrucomicrobiota bacterium]